MTMRRAAAAILGILVVVGLGWWGIDRFGDGQSCDDGRGIRFDLACVDLDATILETTSSGIDDLRQLERFGRLRSLEISLRDIDGDLAGLAELDSLETLIIRGSEEAVDLSMLEGLAQLQVMQLTGFEGRNLSGVSLPALEVVIIDDMAIDGLPVMEALIEAELRSTDLESWDRTSSPRLRQLQIWDGDGLRLDEFAGLMALEQLAVYSTFDGGLGLDDFDFVDALPNLEVLILNRGGTATDLSPLAGLPLRELVLEGFPISDLTPLGAITTLEVLSIRDAPVTTLEPLESLHRLRSLAISESELRTMDGIEALTAIEHLRLNRNSIRDLGPLAGLTGLVELNLDETEVEDLNPLASLTRLELLSLWGAPVVDIASLEGLPLTNIDLNSTNVESVAPLATTDSLESLRIGATAVTDLSPLRDLPNLERLVPPEGPGAGSREEVIEVLAG